MSTDYRRIIRDGLWDNNIVFSQSLALCPLLAVTGTATNGIGMGAATTVVTERNKDPIHARYERLLEGGTKPTLAKLSLARMIAATVLRMWKNEEAYNPERAGLPAKTRKG
jgi:Na+-translocating ferredoxin:NAD+ oxidoreductase RnfA subunit